MSLIAIVVAFVLFVIAAVVVFPAVYATLIAAGLAAFALGHLPY